MASLESRTHDTDVTSAVKGVITPTVCHLDQLVDDGLALGKLGGVDKVGSAELACPLLFGGVDVDDDDLASLLGDSALYNAETDAAGTEDGDVATLVNVGCYPGSSVTGCDAASEEAGAVHWRLRLDSYDGDVGDDCVLAEGGSAHEVQDVLPPGPEAGSAIGHETLALGCADLAAEIGLARLAELAFLALGGVKGNDVVADLYIGNALADGLDGTGTLVSEDNGEGTLWVLARECVCVCLPIFSDQVDDDAWYIELTCVADTGILDLDADLMGLWGCNLDILVAELLASLPGNGSLASDGLDAH